jgi:hypothetical protein
MSYTRDQAASYLARTFSALVTFTGQTSVEDDTAGFGLVIDDALRTLGVAESDLATYEVESSQVKDYLALLRYYALNAFSFGASTGTSWSVLGESANNTYVFANLEKMLDRAKAEAESLGYTVDTTGQFVMGTIELGFLEPSEEVA